MSAKAAAMPSKAGFYWAKWRIANEGTREADELTPSDKWEVVDVFENSIDPSDDEYLMVHVPGVTAPQNLENFYWGDGPIVRGGLTYPAEMTPQLEHVLGLMNFSTGPIAHRFQAAGRDIKRKAEAEQAFVLDWLIRLVLQHGDRWAEVADEEIAALKMPAARS